MARGAVAPALISSPEDIIEFLIEDASPVDPNAPKPVMERHIHSEIYKRFSGINSVVHSHSPAVLPYAISNVPLKAAIHMAGFLGEEVPVFDISQYYNHNDTRDLLVTNVRLGAALAAKFSADSSQITALPDHSIVLMRSHGFAGCAADIKTVVYQALYTQHNAQVQSDALNLEHAHGGSKDDILYLTPQEARDSYATIGQNLERPWSLWVREVEVSPLYVNSVSL
ncbi:hypothetical protein RRF57_004248 [Xylaria bambusicola]|uniref:Class II aldolase/adducin N-terminal domain-containing protein n=1 Tax=Xylaria bambusicola TaxID=326684 RepID=A0AAN7UIY4_9PEZI